MPYADNDDISLYYEIDDPTGGTEGAADRPEDSIGRTTEPTARSADRTRPETVVLVEGLGYGRWMWRWQRDRLADEGYRVVVWDNRGTGDSDAPEGPYTIAEMASDLDAVLDAAGVEQTHVVGASMGGMIAQQYALDYGRAASLSLLCTSHGGEDAYDVPPETQARMFDVPDDASEREAIRYKMAPAMTDEFREEHDDLIADIVDWRLAGDASDEAREAQAAGVMGFDASDHLDEISVPVLVAHGTDDEVLPVENADLLHGKLPNGQLAVFEDGPHLFFVERADAVNDRLVEFLDHA